MVASSRQHTTYLVARRKRDAVMATHGKIDEFDPSHKAWATYVERLEFYFIANGIEDPEKKRAVLLTVSGPATYKLIRNLSAPMLKNRRRNRTTS